MLSISRSTPSRFITTLLVILAIVLGSLSLGFGLSPALGAVPPPKVAQISSPASTSLVISQVYGGGGSSSATPYCFDYIELFNPTSAAFTMNGWSVQYGSAANNFSQRLDLPNATIPAGGYFLIQTGSTTTGTCTALPAPDASTTSLNMSATNGKVALVNNTTTLACGATGSRCWTNPSFNQFIVDMVGYGTSSDWEGTAAAPALTNSTAAVRLNNGCTDTDNNNTDFQATGTFTPRNSASPLNPCGGATPSSTETPAPSNTPGGPTETSTPSPIPTNTSTSTAVPPTTTASATSAPVRLIREIQGLSHLSPYSGTAVSNVFGIVTVKRSNGFWMQDPNPDSDNGTSEGIFVFGSSAANLVNVGNAVLVSGTVTEFRPGCSPSCAPSSSAYDNLTTTEITSPSVVTSTTVLTVTPVVVGNGGRVPPNMIIEDDATGNVEDSGVFDADTDGIDFYESLEGMLVQVNNAVVVGPTARFNSAPPDAEVYVAADNGVNASLRTVRGGVVVRPNDFNPERIIVSNLFHPLPDLNVNDTFTAPIVGVYDYNFGKFLLHASQPFSTASGGLSREVAATPTTGEVSIATFNVENLDPGDPASKFEELAGLIVNNLKSPDIVTIEEIQDNDGPTNSTIVSATVTYNMLISYTVAAGGPEYQFQQVDPVDDQDGGEPGGNIRVGFLYRVDRGASFVARPGGCSTCNTTVISGTNGPELSFSPGRIDPNNTAFNNSRKPLVGEFMFNGQRLFLIGNHFNSKGGDDPLFGRFQPPVLSSEAQRIQQAQIVNNFVDSILALDSNAKIVVLGDINDFEFSTPMAVLRGTFGGGTSVLTPLMETLSPNERYSYVFQGNSQSLDHIIVSNGLLGTLTNYDPVHVNAEFAVQASDHDPQVAFFNLAGSTPTVVATGTSTALPTGTATAVATSTSTVAATSTAGATVTPSGVVTRSLLLIPDWTADRVMAFDPFDGESVNLNFIPSDPTNLSSPKNAILSASGNSILVSDQIDDVVREYGFNGAFIRTFAPAGGPNPAILDNILGIALRPNGNLLVSVTGGGNDNSIAEFDTNGNFVGQFIAAGAGGLAGPFDVYSRTADYLVSSIDTNQVLRYSNTGAFLGVFTSISDWPQQINEAANGNVLVADFSGTSNGVNEYTAAGTFVARYSVITGNRGAIELGNGNILTTDDTGVYEISRANVLVDTEVTGVNAQYIERVVVTMAGGTATASVVAGTSTSTSTITAVATSTITPVLPTASPTCAPASTWVIVPSQNVGTEENRLQGVAAVSSNYVWAVGYYKDGGVAKPLIQRWDGSSWTIVPSPAFGLSNNYLLSVTAISANDAWAVGYYRNLGSNEDETLTMHWDGTAWSVVSSPNHVAGSNSYLHGVSASASNDVWAVGWWDDGDTNQLYAIRWNGTSWTQVTLPDVGPAYNVLNGVTAISPNDVWAVGVHYSGNSSSPFETLTLHWNGTSWSMVEDATPANFNSRFEAVDASSPNDVWAVGWGTLSDQPASLIQHWNGTAWSIVNSPSPGTMATYLQGVSATAPNDAWAVGAFDNGNGRQTLTMHWDGTQWLQVASPHPTGPNAQGGSPADRQQGSSKLSPMLNTGPGFAGVAAVSDRDIWAVGAYGPAATSRTLIERYYNPNPCPVTPTITAAVTNTPTRTVTGTHTTTRTTIPTLTLTVMPSATRTNTATVTAVPTQTNTSVVPSSTTTSVPPTITSTAVPPTSCPLQFTDVPPSNTFYQYIRCLVCRGIISGYSDGTFRPNNDITRGQIAKIVSQSAGFSEPAGTRIYEDVPEASPFFVWIQRLSNRGLVGGYPCGTVPSEPCLLPDNRPYYRPNASATRGQISKIVASAAGINTTPSGQTYEDVGPDNAFYVWIERLSQLGVMGGYPCGTVPSEPCGTPNRPYFRPNNNVTRGQASKIVANTFFPNCVTP